MNEQALCRGTNGKPKSQVPNPRKIPRIETLKCYRGHALNLLGLIVRVCLEFGA